MFRLAIPAAVLALCSTAGMAQTLPPIIPLPPLISSNGVLSGVVPPLGSPIAFLVNTGNALVPVLLGRLALPTTVSPSAAPGFSLPSLPPGIAEAMAPFNDTANLFATPVVGVLVSLGATYPPLVIAPLNDVVPIPVLGSMFPAQ